MNIDDKLTISDAARGVQSVQSVSRPQAAQKTAVKQAPLQQVPQGDRVQISDRARVMQAALEQIKQMPEIDEDKVARIKAEIQSGTYRPDSSRVAQKMIAEALLANGI